LNRPNEDAQFADIMAGQDDFELWLGRISDRGGGARDRFANRVIRSANLAGGLRHPGASSRGRFDGSRIGRGAGVGRVLASGTRAGDRYARRAIVKASIVRLGPKGLARATAHMRYLQRDGTTRTGERGSLYSAEQDIAEGKAFVERGGSDRHQFRFIVAPEDGSEYEDLKPLVRRLMTQAEKDLGTRLDWVAVDHFNTGHPHAHVIVRGKDDKGKDLIIAREYISQGLRERAAELVNLDLGPRSELEVRRAQLREVEQERFTEIDRRLIRSADASSIVDPRHRNPVEQDLRTTRLRKLARLGLAEELRGGRWQLDAGMDSVLRRMGERGDIIATLNRELKLAKIDRPPPDHSIYEPSAPAGPVVGRLVGRGLSDEHVDRRYLIVDGIDGRTHYVDIGQTEFEAESGAIVSVAQRPVEVREVDRTVARIAAENGGRYNVDIHLAHDRQATEAFATTHVRRLEAIRRTTEGVLREPDGTWIIASDHLERVEAYERLLSTRNPVRVEVLSVRPFEQLADHDGATWLDRELVSETPRRLERGFGAEVRSAQQRRLQWLVAQRLAEIEGDTVRYRGGMIDELERRDLRRVAAALSRQLGANFSEAAAGKRVEGVYTRAVQVGDRKFALIDQSREFMLVPWRPVLEKHIGREVAGIVREGGTISWTIGRSRGLGIS
jgi:type IV secretory pathway VirD2 relaxase